MKIEIKKRTNKGIETEFIAASSFNVLVKPDNLLLLKENEIDCTPDKNELMILVHKIQFIASCKSPFNVELVVAFYLNDNNQFMGHVISDLPYGFYSGEGYLVDYASYVEICELTNEKIMSLIEYFCYLKRDGIGINSFLEKNEMYLNYDKQQNSL
jgi:hypothetical protein